MSRPTIRVRAAALLVTVAALLTACTTAPMPVPTTTPTHSPTPLGDGVLRIGTLFPSTGPTSFLAAAQVAGVNAAVRDINAAGGVLGQKVQVISRNSGDSTTLTAEKSFDDLVAHQVDVVIGPTSSVLAERLLPKASAAGVPMISPSATYPSLTTADHDGMFSRTITSYPHQGVVLGTLITDQNSPHVALVAGTDPVSSTLAAPLAASLKSHQGDLVADIDVMASTTPSEVVAALKTAAPDAVVLATPDNGAQTVALISAIVKAGFGGAKLWLTSENLADYSKALPKGTLTGVNGIIQGAIPDATFTKKLRQEDPGLRGLTYGAEAYDATVLVALAALLAHDDAGRPIAAQLRAASRGGIVCSSFGECADVLADGRDIDYEGVSGSLTLDTAGDPTVGGFSRYRYAATGSPAYVGNTVG